MPARAFADVLEETLRTAGTPGTPRPLAAGISTAADPFIYFTLPQFARSGAAGRTWVPRAAPGERRPRRPLTQAQRTALDGLNALGANLPPEFTAEELRRAYRRLALRFHPDRHPGRSDPERRQLAERFSEATSHYRQLLASTPPHH